MYDRRNASPVRCARFISDLVIMLFLLPLTYCAKLTADAVAEVILVAVAIHATGTIIIDVPLLPYVGTEKIVGRGRQKSVTGWGV